MRVSLTGMRWVALCLLVGACSFDGGGVSDDEPAPDAILVTVDADGCDGPDEDGDGFGNACDNCPHVANADQDDGEGDGAGDACDPQPDEPGNALLYFEGFDDPDVLDDWRVFNGGMWEVRDGALHQTELTGLRTLYLGAQRFEGAHAAARFVVDELGAPSGSGFGTFVAFDVGAGEGAGYYCIVYDNSGPESSIHLLTFRGAAAYLDEAAVALGIDLAADTTFDVTETRRLDDDSLQCGLESPALPQPVTIAGSDDLYPSGFVAVKTQSMAAHVEYVAVFAMP